MTAEVRSLALWLGYAASLVVIFFGIDAMREVPTPPPPPPRTPEPTKETITVTAASTATPPTAPTVKDPISTSTLRLASSGDFRELDARGAEVREVVFRLDPPPVKAPLSIAYQITGTAACQGVSGSADFEVIGGGPTGRVVFAPAGGGVAKLQLRRLKGLRGMGDRTIVVEGSIDADSPIRWAAEAARTVELRVPDPLPTISWEFVPIPTNGLGPAEAGKIPFRVSISPPSSRLVEFRYIEETEAGAVRKTGGVRFEPPKDPWALDRQTQDATADGSRSRLAFRAKPPAVRERPLRLVAEDASAASPQPIQTRGEVPVAKGISGSVLMVLVLTSGVGAAEFDAVAAFQDLAAKSRDRPQLVDGTAFVLDAEGVLSTFDRSTVAAQKRFPARTRVDAMLGAGIKDVFGEVRQKLTSRGQDGYRGAILIRDLGEPEARGVVKGFRASLRGKWDFYWIDPAANPKLETDLRRSIEEDFVDITLQVPRAGLAGTLTERLEK